MSKNSEDLRTRIVVLHKDSLVYKKFGNSLELSYSTVARVIQRFSKTGFTLNRPRKGRSKKLSPCAVRQVQKLTSTNVWCRHFFRGCRSGRSACQSSDHMPHTLQQVGLDHPRRKPLLKLAHKKACKQFAEYNLVTMYLTSRRMKAVLENNGALTKYWHFGHRFDMFT